MVESAAWEGRLYSVGAVRNGVRVEPYRLDAATKADALRRLYKAYGWDPVTVYGADGEPVDEVKFQLAVTAEKTSRP